MTLDYNRLTSDFMMLSDFFKEN